MSIDDGMVLRLMKGTPYITLQGEGVLTGTPTIFVRTAGCDLRCHREGDKYWNCDTPLSLPDYNHKKEEWAPLTDHAYEISPEELAKLVTTTWDPCVQKHIAVTGGEPMLQAEKLASFFAELTFLLRGDFSYHVTLETNARHFNDVLAEYVNLPSLSPKLQTYGANEVGAITQWLAHCAHYGKECQLKIVCCDEEDYKKARTIFQWAKTLAPVHCLVQPGWERSDMASLTKAVMRDGEFRLLTQVHKALDLP